MSLSWTAAAGWLVHCAVGGGLLLLLTCLLIRRTRQPARRQRLGELGLAAALVLALLSLRPPWLVLDWPAAADAAGPVARAEAPPAAEEPPDDDLVVLLHAPPAPAPAVPQAAEAVHDAAPPAPAPRLAEAWWQAALLMLLPWLVVAHVVCGSLLLARWLLGHYALARLLRGASPAPREVTWLFRVMAPRGLRPRLLVAPRLRVPLSFGLLRPTVVLPASLCAPPDLHKLRWVFAHELTHLERRDAWSALLFAVGQAVYFFLPWFGWLRRQVRLCQEYVADAAAAGRDEPPVDYAEFLLSLTGAPAAPAAAASVSGTCSDLYRRVTMLLKEPLRVEKRCPRRWSLAAAGGLFALAILVGGVGLRADAAQVVVIVPAPDGKPGQAEKEKKVRVLVAPGEEGDARVREVHKEGGQGRKVIIINEQVVPPQPPQPPEGVKAVREVIINKVAGEVRREALRDHEHQLQNVRKILLKLEQQPGAAEIEAARKDLRRLLGQVHGGAGLRAVQRPEDVVILQGKKDLRGTEAALQALRKALDKLGDRPELEAAREQLKNAIKQLEKVHKGDFGRGAPELRLDHDKDGKIELRFGPGKGAQWNFGGAGGGWFAPGKPVDAELLKKIREEIKNKNLDKAEELLKKALERAQGQPWQQFNFQGFKPELGQWQGVRPRTSGKLRLGVSFEKPSAALADQLNLPAGKGLIIRGVEAGSPAAKAGLKVNDVLLELNGQPVSSDVGALHRSLEGVKGGAARTVVLRKGKRETIDITLGEAPADGGARVRERLADPNFFRQAGGPGNVMTTLFRSGDRFTTRYQEGSLIITVTGTVAGGKAKAGEIHIQDGRESHKYDSVERVPAQHRDKVNHLIELSGRGEMRIQGRRQ